MRSRSIYDRGRLLGRWYWRLKTNLFYRCFFARMGKNCLIERPMTLNRPERIHLGDAVTVQPGVRLEVVRTNPQRDARIEIGSNVNIEQGVHMLCQNLIKVGDRVSICAYSCVVDIDHPYAAIADPRRIGDRHSDDGATVEIGENTFVGFGSTILPGARIGRHVVIGAGSVVSGVIPDYCVAVGTPARVVKRYDFSSQSWKRVTE